MIDHGLDLFRWNGRKLVRGPMLDVKGALGAVALLLALALDFAAGGAATTRRRAVRG